MMFTVKKTNYSSYDTIRHDVIRSYDMTYDIYDMMWYDTIRYDDVWYTIRYVLH